MGHTDQFICGMCGSREIFEMTCCFARADLVWVEDYTQLPYVEHPFWLFLTINSSTPCPHGIIYFCTKFYTWNWAGGIFKMNKNYFTESMQESSIDPFTNTILYKITNAIYSKPNEYQRQKGIVLCDLMYHRSP